ncbi:MAG: hypothetical protein ACXVEW_02915 [Solirubrobacteraceae bacterium]
MAGAFAPNALANETVLVCDVYGNHVASLPSGVLGIGATSACPGNDQGSPPSGGMEIYTVPNRTVKQGSAVAWRVNAPAGLTISGVYIPHMWSYGIDDGSGWVGGFYWAGGSGGVTVFDQETGWSSAYQGTPKFTWPASGTPYFGWQVACFSSSCTDGGSEWLSVELLELNMAETTGPAIDASRGIWGATNTWIRGSWPLIYSADSPSGVCSLNASLNAISIPGSSSAQNPSIFHQCAAPTVQQTINTASYGNGAVPLSLSAADAAGLSASVASTVYLDNEPVSVSLSGPTDAPVSAGTQYITATATAGPSGVNGIECSLDDAPYRFYPGSSTQLAVQGVGVHQASCFARNNSVDPNGVRATSPVQSWTLHIREPSVATVAFSRVINALRCSRKHIRVRIPAHWTTVMYHGKKVHVRVPAQTRTVTIVHCHPRIVRRRVVIHGRVHIVKVVLLPRTVSGTSKRVRHGATTTVNGWVGTVDGNALAGVPVRVMTAPDNGSLRFRQAAIVTSAANGSWTAKLPPGPSRLVQAVYDGASTVEPAASAPANVIVPASLKLRVGPRSTHWGSTIKISGQVRGGYIPAAGELVILHVGWGGGSTEIGHLYTDRKGRFHTRYTFLRGNGTLTYRLWASTARETDYPYVPSRSRKVSVTVRQ